MINPQAGTYRNTYYIRNNRCSTALDVLKDPPPLSILLKVAFVRFPKVVAIVGEIEISILLLPEHLHQPR